MVRASAEGVPVLQLEGHRYARKNRTPARLTGVAERAAQCGTWSSLSAEVVALSLRSTLAGGSLRPSVALRSPRAVPGGRLP